jgi:VIT1/CCC1 family predicted Fe2+/Mn2+ transporter
LEQERYEIQHHRKQEREELKELYRAKGLEGKLLDDVIDVLMADDERLLKVMVEEELCLQVESETHPLKKGTFAFLGGILSLFISLSAYLISPQLLWFSTLAIVGISSFFEAVAIGNKRIPSLVWNLGTALGASLTLYFLCTYLKGD